LLTAIARLESFAGGNRLTIRSLKRRWRRVARSCVRREAYRSIRL